MRGKKFYIKYQPYVVFMAGGKAHTRKLYNDDISKLTGKVRYQNRMVDIEYHY